MLEEKNATRQYLSTQVPYHSINKLEIGKGAEVEATSSLFSQVLEIQSIIYCHMI